MIPTPKRFKLVTGAAEGKTKLTAFDKALLDAGAGNLNLIKVSSILPPGAEYDPDLKIKPGSITPVAYGTITSVEPGERIAAAVATGIPKDTTSFGMIMEHTANCSSMEIEDHIRKMVIESFEARNLELKEIKVASVEHKVQECGSVFAGVLLWY